MEKRISTEKGEIFIRRLAQAHPSAEERAEAVQLLVAEVLAVPGVEISHAENGKPYLEGHASTRLSVSHAGAWIAVYISRGGDCGVDIEPENAGIARAKAHFINPAEQERFALSPQELHLIWSAKEAIFKHFEGRFEALEKDVAITGIDIAAGKIEASTIHGNITCGFEIFSGNYIVWT